MYGPGANSHPRSQLSIQTYASSIALNPQGKLNYRHRCLLEQISPALREVTRESTFGTVIRVINSALIIAVISTGKKAEKSCTLVPEVSNPLNALLTTAFPAWPKPLVTLSILTSIPALI